MQSFQIRNLQNYSQAGWRSEQVHEYKFISALMITNMNLVAMLHVNDIPSSC